jgi:two-component system response regulator GlrR
MITPDMLLLGKTEILKFRSPDLYTLREARERFERSYLIQVLSAVKGRVSRAANLAGKDRAEFYRLLRRHAIVPSAFKEEKGEKLTA